MLKINTKHHSDIYSAVLRKTYRVSAVVTAYKGSLSESKTMISNTIKA
ncbi:MAG: hypothetical protein OGM11_00655 [Clostridiaceae bacterium]|nr:MAG: hypothetical protein OGM11_00655 [Clostridiaceae bacterium]